MDVSDLAVCSDDVVLTLRRGRARRPAAPRIDDFAGPPTPVAAPPVGIAGEGEVGAEIIRVFFERASYPIPEIGLPCVGPDVAAFAIVVTRFGYLAAVPRPSQGRPPSRAHWIVAACLPLALLPNLAQAAPAGTRWGSKPTAVEASATEGAKKDGASEATPATGDPTAPVDPADETGDDMIVEPRPSRELPTAPPVVRVLCPEPAAVSTQDAAWEGVKGYDVELILTDDREVTGRVTAIQRDTFTLVDLESGGVVRVIQKNGVKRMRVKVYDTVPSTKDGTGLLVGGGLLTAVGTPVFLTGAVFLGVCPSCTYLHIPMLMVGGAALGAAIPMLVRGARRRRAYNESRTRPSIGGAVSFTRQGWTGGLRLRF